MNISQKNNERREQTISPELTEMLVNQISHELQNHNIYRTFANYFALEGLQLLEEYFIERAEEELDHHRWIVDRLNYCDVPFAYPSVPAVEIEITDRIFPFSHTVDLEIETTELIFKIADRAKEEGDWQTVKWLQDLLIDEQTEEESISRLALDIAKEESASWFKRAELIKQSIKK